MLLKTVVPVFSVDGPNPYAIADYFQHRCAQLDTNGVGINVVLLLSEEKRDASVNLQWDASNVTTRENKVTTRKNK